MVSFTDLLNGSGWTQHERLLTLHTPLGPDALIAETVEIQETLGPISDHAGFYIQLTALSTDTRIPLTQLLGQAVRLDLQTAHARNDPRPFHGHITQATRESADGGLTRYRLIIEPWLAFLGLNQDNYLFQDKSVLDIIDELLGDWQGQGKLAPAWRWNLADPAAYPKRGITTQYQESDLAFLRRLLAEEGLFHWFEHTADTTDTLGQHTLVLADHNSAFTDNRQARIRYTQSGASHDEDTLDRWHGTRQLDTGESQTHSWDYRSLTSRPQNIPSAIDNGAVPPTIAQHDPGQYAWQNNAQGERMIGNQRQALDARLKQYQGQGTVRTAAPGTQFELAEHFEHDHDPPDQRRFLITRVTHQARNNLGQISGGNTHLAGSQQTAPTPGIDHYRNRLTAIRAAIPWRPLLSDTHGRHIHPRPTARGTLTGLVVGGGGPTHTDRDGRIRVQFPWQRGTDAASRQPHPTASDNAPGDASLGVWLRVLTPIAGNNWGGHHTPRPGQEVIVAFQNGNIDRPIVIGATYNGRGQSDAQGNQIAGGTMQASANAPAWFAGEQDPEHTHGASLSGLKSQQLGHSRDGQGGHNQLLFDDTPGEGRIELGTSQYQSALQLGHLKQQTDNARQKDRGHGGELATQASLSLRAGHGLLLSADARPNAGSTHLDSREAIARHETAQQLGHELADLAQKQNAALKDDPVPEKLPALAALRHAGEVLGASASRTAVSQAAVSQAAAEEGAAVGGGDIKATLGGGGTVPAWSEPRLQMSAPGGIVQVTPQNHFLVAGAHLTMVSEQDTQLISQGRQCLIVRDGLALFAHGKSQRAGKPNQESGIHLHAASGKVSLQAQSGKLTAAADKSVTIASTHANLNASAKTHVLATAQGAYLKLEGGNIELHAPGKVEFRASLKRWDGPASASPEGLTLPKAKDLYDEQFRLTDKHTGKPMPYFKYRIEDGQGKILMRGYTDKDGFAARIHSARPDNIKILPDEG